MKIDWTDNTAPDGTPNREFRIRRDGARDITGACWMPADPTPGKTLVCFGHGASGDRYQPPIASFARRISQDHGLPVLSIDGPVHGLRAQGDGGRDAFWPEFTRDAALDDMTADWTVAIDAIQALPEVGKGKLAYWGLSMGSIFGFPLIASRDDVIAAVLGLFGIQDSMGRAPFPHVEAFERAAASITCPVLFMMQLEDELFPREGYLRAFDALASDDKRILANPGLHPEIPVEDLNYALDYLVATIEGRRGDRKAARTAE